MPGATVSKAIRTKRGLQVQGHHLAEGHDGMPCTGLDADGTRFLSYPDFPQLPVATYTGDGFGGPGSGWKRTPIDAEGLFLAEDGSWSTSNKYGTYVYHFDSNRVMIGAIRPPDAVLPLRNGSVSFSADSPLEYIVESDGVIPANPTQGRQTIKASKASP